MNSARKEQLTNWVRPYQGYLSFTNWRFHRVDPAFEANSTLHPVSAHTGTISWDSFAAHPTCS
jgi:hypothetical protein